MKTANKMAADSIMNYKTVPSFGNMDEIMKVYGDSLRIPIKLKIKSSVKQGISFGFSQFVTFALFAALFYFNALF